jgi:O-antigen/teichoic acid export membrane protein
MSRSRALASGRQDRDPQGVTDNRPDHFGIPPAQVEVRDVPKPGMIFAGSVGLTFAGSVLGAVFSVFNEALAARFLGIEAYGSYGIALMLAKVGEIIAVFGVPLSVLHFLPIYLSQLQFQLALGVIVGGLLLPLAVGFGFAFAAGLWHEWIAAEIFHQAQVADYIAVFACAIPFMALSDLLGNIARGFGRPLPYIIIRNLVPPLCYMPVLIGLSFSSGPKIGAAYGYTAGVGVGAATGLIMVLGLVWARIGRVRPVVRLRSLYTFAVPIALNSWVTLALILVDQFLLVTLTDVKTAGIYRGCVQVVIAFDLILSACSAAIAPICAVLMAEDRQRQLQETLTGATRIATLAAAPLMLVILINGGDILGLLGEDFRVGWLALSILTLGQFVKGMFGVGSIILVICGRQSLEAAASAFAACLNFVLNFFLIPRIGLLGAAVSTALSLLVLSMVRAALCWFMLRLRVAEILHVRILFVSAPLAVGVWGVSTALGFGPGTGFLTLAFRLAIMGAVMLGGLWCFCLSRNEQATLVGALLRRRPTSARATEA